MVPRGAQVWRSATVSIPSEEFPGQTHVFKLNAFLQVSTHTRCPRNCFSSSPVNHSRLPRAAGRRRRYCVLVQRGAEARADDFLSAAANAAALVLVAVPHVLTDMEGHGWRCAPRR